jgi:calcineurin-like phosphoesterase family protein
VTTVVISDLHVGATSLPDVASLSEPRERLISAIAEADRVVLLGDVLELRQSPIARVLEEARPFFDRLAEATRGKEVVMVAGNHDHQLAEPWLSRRQIEDGDLPLESRWKPAAGDGVAGRLAEWMPGTELSLAYPGLWLRPGVYAIHGHYLDVHLTVPRIESVMASVMERVTGRSGGCATPADYEAVLAPMYALLFGIAQGTSEAALRRGGRVSRRVWRRVNDGDGGAGRFLLARVTIPGAVAALNGLGLGPFRSELTGPELRRAGLLAMSRVVEGLRIGAEHVLFGHTHRTGPLGGDDPGEWRTPGGTRLWNTGSWLVDTAFVAAHGPRNPYWPGTVVRVMDEGQPEIVNVLEDVSLPAFAGG